MTDKELLEQFQMVSSMVENSAVQLREEIRESETRIRVFIENTLTNQIKALFDGCQGALENQALLRIANETLARQIDDLQNRVTILENKTA